MLKHPDRNGFSLVEVLLAITILAVGMLLVAGVFPVALYFTTVSSEKTIAAVAADEAFAKVRIYAIGDPNADKSIPGKDDIDISKLKFDELSDFNNVDIFPAVNEANAGEFVYPSDTSSTATKQYYWSALCRRFAQNYDSDPNVHDPNRLVQVTVFVCRKTGSSLKYFAAGANGYISGDGDYPVPVKIKVSAVSGIGNENKLIIDSAEDLIDDGFSLVDDETGRIYRVLKRYPDRPDTILLDKDWMGSSPQAVWICPPPIAPGKVAADKVSSGRYPCIEIYQKVIKF